MFIQKMKYWLFWTFAVIVCFQAEKFLATAASLPWLTCEVTRTRAGGFEYRLSRPIDLSQCQTCWEDGKRNVIAQGSNFNHTLATHLTNQSITMKECWEYLHFTKDNLGCSGDWEDAHCRVNCSLVVDPPLSSVNSTNKYCITKTWCPGLLPVCLVSGGLLAILVFLLAPYFWRRYKHKRGVSAATRATYTPADQQIQMDREDVGDQHKVILL